MGPSQGSDRSAEHRRLPVLWLAFLILGLVGLAAPAHAQGDTPVCPVDRPIMFAEFDWPSGRLHTALGRFVFEEAYGCKTSSLPGATIPLLAGLRRGDVDVAMEVWIDRATEVWEDGIEAGEVTSVGVNYPRVNQGWYVPRYLIEGDTERGIEAQAPDLRTVEDLKRYAALFRDPEEPSKGRFYNCILGWQCEINNTKKLHAYGLLDSFTNFSPGTGAALVAAMASHYAKGEPFVAYYWDPSWVTARYDLVLLQEPPHTPEKWAQFAAARRPDMATAFPPVSVHVGVNTEFQAAAPDLIAFLAAYETTMDMNRQALLHMRNNPRLEGEDLARWFLKTQDSAWRAWLEGALPEPAPAVARIEAALAED